MSDDRPQSAASSARRATGDPSVFLIPEESLPPGFAEKVDDPALVPVPPRPAATVVLLREGGGGLEALLLRRHKRSGFAAGAWVFPGGVVDPRDSSGEVADRLDGPTPGEWAERLEVDAAEALGYVAAAIREAFEETGILLARPDPEGPTQLHDAESMAVARRALLNDVVSLRDVAVGNGLRLMGDALVYIAHWITPEPEPRRYDTRFFAARAPEDAACEVHDAEMTDAVWLPPREAVERFRAGQMKLLPPTVRTLEQLASFADFGALRAALEDAPVPTILPRMRRDPGGVSIVVPPPA
ncbi:MAG TPA: NUDIX domain-containing protein [Longimicrobium sp.]